MNRLSKLLLVAALALGIGLASCSKNSNKEPENATEGNTFMSISLRLSADNFNRSLPDDYNNVGTWDGKDNIKRITVFISDASSLSVQEFEVGTGKPYSYDTATRVIKPANESAAIRTTPGWKEVFVLINPTQEIYTHLGITAAPGAYVAAPAALTVTPAEFKNKYEKTPLKLENKVDASTPTAFTVQTSASKLAKVQAGNDEIAMTHLAPQALVVAPHVLKDATVKNANPVNRVSLEVERSVARVVVTQAQDTYNVPSAQGGTVLGTISEVTWVLAQGENALFVQRKGNWETPSYGWIPSAATYNTEAKDRYDYSGLFENYNKNTGLGGTPVPVKTVTAATPIGEHSVGAGKFILPTMHEIQAGLTDPANSKFKKGNTSYVMIRAKFKPAAFADTDQVASTDKAGTFYLGGNGKFYHTSEAALDPAKGGVPGQTVAKYDGGKVIYYAWVNPDKTDGQWMHSPVIRNNIYHIHIKGFKTIGTNWNPLFPEDPNTPKTPEQGGNPDPKPNVPGVKEPENPIKPDDPLVTPETWMSVDVAVKPWIVHSYGIDLSI